MRDVVIAITAASYSGNKGAAAMLQSSIRQLYEKYGERLNGILLRLFRANQSSCCLLHFHWQFFIRFFIFVRRLKDFY